MNIIIRENSQIWMPRRFTITSIQVVKKAARNHITNETKRVMNVTAVLLKRLASFAGRIFHTGRKNRFVAKIPSGYTMDHTDTDRSGKEALRLLERRSSRFR